MGLTMAEKYEDDISNINSDDLLSILKTTAEKGFNGKFHEIFMEHLDEMQT